MSFIRSLRAKTILSALIPTVLGLVAVAIIALYAYDLLARDVVQQRDTELVRISAARVSDSLTEYTRVLQILAAEKDVQSMELLRAVDALAGASDQLALFDAGVVIYNSNGNALWGRPVTPRRRGTEFPLPSEFDKIRETLQPVFSPIFYDEITREDAILVGVPVLDSERGFVGVVAGLYTLGYSLVEAEYSEALEFQAGQGGYAYLVDGKGRVIDHPDGSQVGRDLADTEPVTRATSGETGAILTEDETGETVISGFAPVAGTEWGLITQQSWESVVGPIRGYSNLLLGLLLVGGIGSCALVFFFLGRVLRPIQDLTEGAQRIAGGDFDYNIVAETGDEVEALAERFNAMASALKESYANLERRVADRTKELAALNTVAQSVSRSLELEPMLSATLDKALEVLDFESGAIYLKDLKTGELEMACHRGLSEEFRTAATRGLISARTAESGKPLIIDDLTQELDAPKEVVEEGYRSVASVPLFSKGRIQGVLTAASRDLRRFRQQDVDLLLSIGNQIGVAIDNARLFDAEQRRAEQFGVISEAGRHMISILDVDELLGEIVRLVKETFGYYLVAINLIEGDELVTKRGLGPPWDDPQFRPLPLKVGKEGITGWVAATGEPLLVPDVNQEPRYIPLPGGSGTKSELVVPLRAKTGVIGVLNVESDQLNDFDETDLAVLQSLARQAAIAIENARLFDAEQRRAEQFGVISEMGRHITSILDVDELLEEIVRLLEETFGYYLITIGLIEGDELVFRAGIKTGWDETQFRPPSLKMGGKGVTAWVAATGEPLLAPDVSKEPQYLFLPDSAETRSELAVPLKTKTEVIGVLNVESDQPNAFDESDLAMLQSLANQAVIAIENARLFNAEQRRAEQFGVISEVGRRIISILDVHELLEEIVRLVKETFGYHLVQIGLIEGEEMVFNTGLGPTFDDPQFQPPRVEVGREGVTAWVAATGEPLLVPDVSQDPRYLLLPGWSEIKSELAVPLKTKIGVIGVLDVESDQVNAFDESDLVVLQSLANQAAIAIENAQLYEDIKSRLAQVIALQETTKAVASTLEVDKLLNLITEQATALLQADGGTINLIDWEKNEDEVVASTGSVAVALGLRSPLEGSLSGWAALHNQPAISSQLEDDERVDREAFSWMVQRTGRQVRSIAVAPLTIKGQVIGTLVVVDKEGGEGEFDQTDLDLLVAFANQAAAAIENARLFDAEQRRAEQFSVISEMGRHMTSILDVDELQREIVRSINETLGYPLVGIALIEGDELVFKTGTGPPFADAHFEPPRIKVGGEGITGWVAAAGEPLLAADVSQQPRYLFLPGSEDTRSELAVPLKTKTEVIGVLDVQSDRLDAFDESDLAVLQSLARQAAIAIEKARLFDAEQRRAEQFRVLSEVGARITSLLTVDELLDETVRLVRESLGYYLVSVGLIEGDDLVFRTGAGGHWEDPRFQPPRLRVGEEGISGWVAATGEPLLAPDVSQEPRFLAIPDVIATRSELAVPLRTKAEVIGVLDVESDQVNAFDETDLAVLQSVANLTAVALEEAHLFDAEQRRAEQFRAISEMGRHMTSILDVDQLLDEIVRVIKGTLGYYLVSIGLIEGDEVAFKTGAGPRWDDPEFQPTRMKVSEEGLTGWVAATGEPLLVPDARQEPRYVPLPDLVETRSELVVPLKTKDEVIGVLNVESDRVNAFDESDLMVLQSLANQAAIAIDNARLFDAEQRRAEQFGAISEMGRHITSILAVDELLNEIVRLIKETFGFYLVDIGIIEGDQLVFTTGADPSFDLSGQQLRVEVGSNGITGWVASTGEPQLVPDVSKEPRYVCLYAPTESRSELCVPIKAKEEVIGVLNVESDQLNAFDESDLMVLQSLANQAAIAIENARLYEQAQQAAALEERSRLARDLHDAVTQTLFSASLIGEVVPTLWESDQEEGRQLLQELRQLTRGALAEMRTLLLELRPAALAEASLDELLSQLAEAITGRMGVPVTVAVEGECDFPSEVHVALYRIAQEALNNVVKHAQATQVAITLRCSPLPDGVDGKPGQRVELLVSDDGRGFDLGKVPPDHLGLGIIRERAEAIGATVEIESQPGQGTQVRAVWKG